VSTVAEITAELERIARCFDFTYEDLGQKLAEANAAGIFEMMEAETGPDGAWAPLSEAYAAWKAERFPGQPISELHLLMKDPAQLLGELQTEPDRMVQTYGTTEEAKQEAVWFQEGGGNQPGRPFYTEFNGLSERLIAEVLDARFDEFLPT
jgi:hypothetical protein